MTNLKREFFFLRKQLRKRFSLLLLAIVACIFCSFICNATTKTYTATTIPARHTQNVQFMKYDDPNIVVTKNGTATMTTLLYKYQASGSNYKVSFALPLNLAGCFMYAMLTLFIVSFVRRIDWYHRFLCDKATKKIDKRRAAMVSLKKALNTSD